MSGDSSKDNGEEASSDDPGSLQCQLERAKAKLAARDASARKYKVTAALSCASYTSRVA